VSPVSPIHREVIVRGDPALAFEVFTERINHWWPVAELSVHGEGGSVSIVENEIVERSKTGAEAVWGTITRWEPAVAIAFTWHPGRGVERASHVAITFTAVDDGTLVTLEHSNWEVFDDPTGARGEYERGWPGVLDHYRAQFGPEVEGGQSETKDLSEDTWVALLHSPGPAAPADHSLYEDPHFAEHLAFLARMREEGHLVAAGPLMDRPGDGMTILRLSGSDQLDQAKRLATEEDTSVASGFFTVTVRPWNVMLTG
jgi:uncharacterized protein YciI